MGLWFKIDGLDFNELSAIMYYVLFMYIKSLKTFI